MYRGGDVVMNPGSEPSPWDAQSEDGASAGHDGDDRCGNSPAEELHQRHFSTEQLKQHPHAVITQLAQDTSTSEESWRSESYG